MESQKPNSQMQPEKPGELFLFTAGQSSESKPCRLLTDDELKMYMSDAMRQHQLAVTAVNNALSQLNNAARFMAVLEFETERREKSRMVGIARFLPDTLRKRD